MAEGTSNFLRLMNEANARIAADEAKRKAEAELDTDQIRLQRDAARREQWGQLRAVPHPSRRRKKGLDRLIG